MNLNAALVVDDDHNDDDDPGLSLHVHCLICSMCASFLGLYEFVIPEDLPLEQMGGRVKANDRDIGENSKSTYNIVEGNDQGVFEIVTDSQTQDGILRLRKVRWGEASVFIRLGANYVNDSSDEPVLSCVVEALQGAEATRS